MVMVGAKVGKVAEAESAEGAATVLPNSQSPSVATFSFETRMWADAPAQVDAVVVSPRTTAYETLAMFGPTEMLLGGEGRPLLYVVDSDFGAREVDSVAEIKRQASGLDREVVTLNARLYQQRYSTQETLEHSAGERADRGSKPAVSSGGRTSRKTATGTTRWRQTRPSKSGWWRGRAGAGRR
jgi:hypothetical protein